MELKSIRIENYRSIVKTTRLQLDPGLTVIVGPNNEGKSNLLRAIALAMECLRDIRLQTMTRPKNETLFRLRRGLYDWDSDFPLSLQSKYPDGESTFSIEFKLNPEEQRRFKKEIGSQINQSLPLEIAVGSRGARIKVRKQGKSAKNYEAKSREIARFVSGLFDFQYIPAIRPSRLSLDVVANLVERELTTLVANPDYKAALKTIEDLQKPVFEQLTSEVQKYLQKLLPSVKSIRISSATQEAYRTRFPLPQFIVDDGSATELDAKGDGIKSLVAISLMRASKASTVTGDLVVAIEEPESHLHPAAVRQLAEVIKEMAKEHQVIITTHSPLMVVREKAAANIIVSNSKANPSSNIRAVRESLGVQIEDSLEYARHVILVEGSTDSKIYSSILSELSPRFAQLLNSGAIAFQELKGANNILYKARNLRLLLVTPILLLDDDKSGREAERKARTEIESRYIFLCKRAAVSEECKYSETELEDLVDPIVYWTQLSEICGACLDQHAFMASREKWSARMRSAFEHSGKTWNDSIESNAKNVIVERVCVNPSTSILPEWRDTLKAIANGIVSIASSDM